MGADRLRDNGSGADAVGGSSVPRRRLLVVLALDAASVTGLVVLARVTRARPGGPGYRALARTAVASLVPGVVAVLWEERSHRPGVPACDHRCASTLLLLAGSALSTAGSVRVLAGCGRGGVRTAGCLLLLGGDVVLVPYVEGARHLHGRPSRRGRPSPAGTARWTGRRGDRSEH